MSLLCTLPAIVLALAAKNDDAAGNTAAAKTKGHIALALNIFAVLFHLVIIIIAIVTPIAVVLDDLSKYYCGYCSRLSNKCSYSYSYSSSYSSDTYGYYSCRMEYL